MRTNLTGFVLTVGMGLIVVLLGLGTLSMAGLVSLVPREVFAENEQQPADEGPVVPRTVVAVTNTYKPASAAEAAAIANGDALFKSNCTQCHAVNEKVVGPALARITKRRTASWVASWVYNSAKVIASGDEYGVKLFNDNGKQQMPSFPQLSNKDIKNILAWVESQEEAMSSGVTNAEAIAVNVE